MKKIVSILLMCIVAASCQRLGKSEQAVLEYMRDQTGNPELKIEFANVQIIKQTVGDSINILQEKYEQDVKEKAEKLKNYEGRRNQLLEQMKSMPKKDMMYQFLLQNVEMCERMLKELNEKVITNDKVRYDGQDKERVIATIVDCQMTSLVNPVLKAKQTKEGSFLLTPDESKCIRQLK